jgi:iron complex transport system permease protein
MRLMDVLHATYPEDGVKTVYTAITGPKVLFLLAAAPVLAAMLLIDIMTGAASLSAAQVIDALIRPDSVERRVYVIVWQMRLPIALMAVCIGASLGLAGVEMQTILGNPLASPYTLGISAAAGFGAALAIVLGVGVLPLGDRLIVPVNAFVSSILCCLLLYFSTKIKRATAETLLLAGIALLFLFNALLALVQYVANPEEGQAVVFWLFGSLMKTTWPTLGVTAATLLIVAPLMMADAWKLTALRLGDEKARSLGVRVERLRLKGFVLVSLLTAVSVSFVGTIGFIGLVAPHMARMMVGEDHRFLLPLSAVLGALVLSSASILSKVVISGLIFPIGIITSLTGVPFFIWLILAQRRRHW